MPTLPKIFRPVTQNTLIFFLFGLSDHHDITEKIVESNIKTAKSVTFDILFLEKMFLIFKITVILDEWLRMGLLPPPREFRRHILSCRELKAASFKRCLHSVLRGVSL